MTPRSQRLVRLLGIRTIELRATARRLALAVEAAATMAGVTRQIAGLRSGATAATGPNDGYAIKAAAATSAALAASGTRHAARAADAERRRATLAVDVQRQNAAADAIGHAIARAPLAAPTEPVAIRRPRR